MNVLRYTFAFSSLAYGALMFVASFSTPAFLSDRGDAGLLITFFITFILFTPFVASVTHLGLNAEETDPALQSVLQRQRKLSRHVRWWPAVTYYATGYVLLSFALFVFTGSTNPFFALFSAASLTSGLWFARVHPTAQALFASTTKVA
jgi:hypothetical protein